MESWPSCGFRMLDDWDRAVLMLCCFSDVKGYIIPCYVAFSLFPLALLALACSLPVSPCQTIPVSFASYAAIVSPCRRVGPCLLC